MKTFVTIFIALAMSVTYAQTLDLVKKQGLYRGNLEIYKGDSIAFNVKMSLEITSKLKDSIGQWKITYEMNKEKDIRDYNLNLVDRTKGHYQLDENNGILLDGYVNRNILTFFFNVLDSFILVEYKFNKNDTIDFDLISGFDEPNLSGNTKDGEEEIPSVLSYPINGRQKGILHKQEGF